MAQNTSGMPGPVIKVTEDEAQARLPELIAMLLAGTAVFIDGPAGETIQLVCLPTASAVNSEGSSQSPDAPDVPVSRPYLQFGSAAGLISMSDDFDEPWELVPSRLVDKYPELREWRES